MTPVFSGGLIYEWSQETSDYGLVELSNGNITLLQDYQNLKAEFASTSMPSGDGGYKASGSASTCPVNGTDFTSWAVLPPLPEGAQNYIDHGAGKALGYSGPSNQGAGGAVRPLSHSPINPFSLLNFIFYTFSLVGFNLFSFSHLMLIFSRDFMVMDLMLIQGYCPRTRRHKHQHRNLLRKLLRRRKREQHQ